MKTFFAADWKVIKFSCLSSAIPSLTLPLRMWSVLENETRSTFFFFFLGGGIDQVLKFYFSLFSQVIERASSISSQSDRLAVPPFFVMVLVFIVCLVFTWGEHEIGLLLFAQLTPWSSPPYWDKTNSSFQQLSNCRWHGLITSSITRESFITIMSEGSAVADGRLTT